MDQDTAQFKEILVSLIAANLDTWLYSGDTPNARATLEGFEGVHPIVENLRPGVQKDGLTREQIEEGIKSRLRKDCSLKTESSVQVLFNATQFQ